MPMRQEQARSLNAAPASSAGAVNKHIAECFAGGGVSLNWSETAQKAWQALNTHPIVVECREATFSAVLGQGIGFFGTGELDISPSDPFNAVIRDHYEPAARSALQWLMVMGIVPVRFERVTDYSDSKTGYVVPIVPDPSTVDIFVVPPTYDKDRPGSCRTTYACFPRNAEKSLLSTMFGEGSERRASATNSKKRARDSDERESAHDAGFAVMQFSAMPPTAEGKLCTPLAACVPFLDEMLHLKELYASAVHSRAHPTLYVTRSVPRGSGSVDPMPSIDLVAGSVTEVAQQECIERLRIEYLEDEPTEAAAARERDAARGIIPDIHRDPLTQKALAHNQTTRSRFVFLPRNHSYVDVRQPEPPPDYLRLLHDHELRIRKTLGFYIGSTPASGVRSSDGTHTSRSSTAVAYTGQKVQDAIALRYRKDINAFLRRSYEIALNIGSDVPATDTKHAIDAKSNAQISLLPSPLVDTRLLEAAYKEGYLSEYMHSKCISAMLSIV